MIRSLDKEDPDSDYFGDPEDFGWDSRGMIHKGWVWSDGNGWCPGTMYEVSSRIGNPNRIRDKDMGDE